MPPKEPLLRPHYLKLNRQPMYV